MDETRAFSVGRYPTKKKIDPGTAADVQKAELEEAQSEIDRLLRIVRNLEREKLQLLCADRGVDGRKVIEDVLAKGSSTSSELVEGEQKKR